MKAAIFRKYGPPEVVTVGDYPTPTIDENEVLIRVKYATVNRTDCGFRSAKYFVSRFFSGLFQPKFHILGCEFSGEITAIGSRVTQYKIGDRVFGFNDTRFGAHAEYLALHENDAFITFPETIDFKTAACIAEGGHYALSDIKKVPIKSNTRVFVNGGTGAIGSAAIAILKDLGAEVWASCRSDHFALVQQLGADHVIDYTTQDFTTLNIGPFDFIFDAVGKSRFRKCKPLLTPTGIYISTELGPNLENPLLALTANVKSKHVLFPIPTQSKEDLQYLLSLVEKQAFQPLIDSVHPLENIVEVYRYVESEQKVGNVLIEL